MEGWIKRKYDENLIMFNFMRQTRGYGSVISVSLAYRT